MFVGDEVIHNDQRIGLSGYREMLERDFREIPDLHFDIELLVCERASYRQPPAFRLLADRYLPSACP